MVFIPSLAASSCFYLIHRCPVHPIMPPWIKKVELKVDINCEKCKTQVMETVTELEGVDEVSLDLQKSVLTVVGKVDPVCVADRLTKIKKKPIIVSIGPPKPPGPQPPPTKPFPLPPVCASCDIVSVTTYNNGGGVCSIL